MLEIVVIIILQKKGEDSFASNSSLYHLHFSQCILQMLHGIMQIMIGKIAFETTHHANIEAFKRNMKV